MANTLPHWIRFSIAALVLFAMRGGASHADESRPWTRSTEFKEAFFTTTLESKIRVYVNAPLDEKGEPARATRIIVYTLPAGNTIEQTLGCQIKPGLHWRYDIQHVAAQIRLLRSLMPEERIVFVCPEGPGLSWSAFRKTNSDADGKMAQLVDEWVKEFGAENARVMLTGHSNGGSFMFGVIDGVDDIPSYIDRIVFLDANYNFDAAKHVQKFQRWLKGSDDHRLVVIAYDDREIMLNGKKVLGPTGGTFRATGRMRDAFGKVFGLAHKTNPPFEETTGLDGRIHFYVHPNPQNKILHTALVGDMNGLVHAATLDTQNEEKWGKFGGPRAYTKWIQAEPAASIKPSPETTKASAGANLDESGSSRTDAVKPVNHPLATKRRPSQLPKSRPKNSVGGSEFVKSLSGLSLDDREAAILREITRGNFPEFLRTFKAVPIIGSFKKGDKEITATLEVSPDYLAVGSDKDFVRMPMTPQTAQLIADQFGCVLPTRKMVDAIDRVAEVHLAPHPMTREREAVTTFMEHHQIIEKQRGDKPLGLLVIGTKKDIVLTPRIFEKPHRLAIYGWRQLNNEPIQPLTIVHGDRYVDYSHGVRLVRNSVAIRGKMVQITELLFDPNRCGLVSDEGPMNPPQYPLK